ncbi:hypothetical protein A1356_14105 [Methylomonas koyamae]|uniref:Uncharacterized protein n=1 Tax=Methylomonas koyamae TaxID=702114 RepID=A0AA91I4W6_9GAMM|nr:hypothetical protein AYM39_21780 [Methylomonas sp. DH-1]OAI25115.1 hypothetical protein A1356_14105 [Methylomonas koyamae]
MLSHCFDEYKGGHVFSLRTFGPRGHFHGHAQAFLQAFPTAALDHTKADKDIFTAGLFNETKAFFILERVGRSF